MHRSNSDRILILMPPINYTSKGKQTIDFCQHKLLKKNHPYFRSCDGLLTAHAADYSRFHDFISCLYFDNLRQPYLTRSSAPRTDLMDEDVAKLYLVHTPKFNNILIHRIHLPQQIKLRIPSAHKKYFQLCFINFFFRWPRKIIQHKSGDL